MLWHRGTITNGAEVPFDLMDRGLLLADGLFETILAVGDRPVLLDEHFARMARGCARLGMAFDRDTAARAVRDLIAAAPGHAVIRVTVTRGAGARGLLPPEDAAPTVFASRADWSEAIAFTAPSLAVGTIRRNATSPLSRIKSLAYLDNVLALEEARRAGADDALMLSTDGGVACASAANVFIVEGDGIVTPPQAVGVLDGVMRSAVLAAARDMGLRAVEEAVTLERLTRADGVFLTNSVRLLMPVRRLDGNDLPQGRGVAERLMAAVRRIVGLD